MPSVLLNSQTTAPDTSVLAIPPVCDTLLSMTKLSPIVSEFETEEEAAAYDTWLRAKVVASLADPRPPIPHDEAMARIRAHIRKRSGNNPA